jgi:PKD repeat protein
LIWTFGVATLGVVGVMCLTQGVASASSYRPRPALQATDSVYVSTESGSDVTGTGTMTTPFATIGYAISQAEAGATIHVAQGTYTENLTLEKSLSLLGGYDASNWNSRSLEKNSTIIDGDDQDCVIEVDVNGGTLILIEGFTLINGQRYTGGGVRLVGSTSVRLAYNWILNNTATGNGGGIYIDRPNGTVTLHHNTISGNTADDTGGGITINRGTVNAWNDVIAANESTSSRAGVDVLNGTLTARHWTLADNGYFAIKLDAGSAVLTNTLVVSHVYPAFSGSGIVADHTLSDEGDPCGDGASCTHTVVGAPRLVNPAAGDYHLDEGSAALDTGVNVGISDDMDHQSRPLCHGYDIGADEWMPFSPLASFTSSGPDWLGRETVFINTTVNTRCVSYLWNFGDHLSSTHPSPTHTYASPGLYTVTLTATNDAGSSVISGAVTIYNPPGDVSLDGPLAGNINTAYPFAATVSPLTATLPVTYVWQAMGQETITRSNKGISDSLPYSWHLPGPKLITVTATNPGGTVSHSHAITVVAAAFPFYEDWEAGVLDWPWSTYTSAQGRVRVSNEYETPFGSYSVLLDDAQGDDIYSTAALILTIDLDGQLGAILDFWWREFDDEDHVQDGVFTSDDNGFNWTKVYSFTTGAPPSDDYQHTLVYLDAETSANGPTFSDHFQIKFQFFDNWGVDQDGYAIDEIRVRGIPIKDVDLVGPTSGDLGIIYTFTATVGPPTVTLPITYTWQAPGHPPDVHSVRRISDTLSLAWSSVGTQTITVTVANVAGPIVNAAHFIDIEPPCIGLESVAIDAPPTAIAGVSVTLTASTGPPTVTQPITYTWQATRQDPATHPGGGLSDTVSFTWNTPAPQVITVTAINQCGAVVSQTRAITVEPPCIELEEVQVTGPPTASVGSAVTFTASVNPGTATQPLTYTWRATGQGIETHPNASLSDTVSFTWNTSGPQIVTVTVANPCGLVVSQTHSLTVQPAPCTRLDQVHITGPPTASVGSAVAFTATVSPDTATQPLTYTWQATGQATETHPNASLNDTASFVWDAPGSQIITVTAVNPCGSLVSETHTTTLEATPCTALDEAQVNGPPTANVGTSVAFVAIINPDTATQPLTYTWRATGQATVTHSNRGLSDTVSFTWKAPGPQTVTVTTTNECSFVVRETFIDIVRVSAEDVIIAGPSQGQVDTLYTFTATVSPDTATPPFTYTWQATEQPPATHANVHSINDLTTFNWTKPGGKTITVTVVGSEGFTDTHVINIALESPEFRTFLPLLVRRWPPIPVTPALDPIPNPDVNASHAVSWTVSWNDARLAQTFVLQRATDSNFADQQAVYTGTATSTVISQCMNGITTALWRVTSGGAATGPT